MRWEALFADMEAQLAAGRLADVRADVAELARAERAAVTLAARLRASVGRPVRVRVGGPDVVEGVVLDAAAQWLLLATSPVRRALVPADAVVAVDGLAAHAAPEAGAVESRLGLGHALRALARDRVAVVVRTAGHDLTGRIERVGADHLDLAEAGGTARGAWAVPFASLRAVQSG
jgi:hypothetical protein